MNELTPQQKSARTKKLNKIRLEEKKRIVPILEEEGASIVKFGSLIETYLDAHVIYTQMYEEWRDEGFPATSVHTNKAGATNEMKHPLAQQVKDWNDKKAKLLEQLSLTPKIQNKNTDDANKQKRSEGFHNYNKKWRSDK